MVKTSIIYTYEYRSYKGEQPKWLNLMFTVNISQQTIAMHLALWEYMTLHKQPNKFH